MNTSTFDRILSASAEAQALPRSGQKQRKQACRSDLDEDKYANLHWN